LERFVKIADGLDVGPALAQLARCPEYWFSLGHNEQSYMALLGTDGARQLEKELPEIWRLIDTVRNAAGVGEAALTHCRVGRMPPGEGLPLHFDGVDGQHDRRFQIALQSEAGAEFTIEDETRQFLAGEAWQVDVSRFHKVRNDGRVDRIVIVFDTRG
jgi:hypothetical protein